MLGKSMAYVEKISKVTPIEGADKIELATVLGYDVAVKKGQFKVGSRRFNRGPEAEMLQGFF
jgi:hypothetical protein